MAIGLSGGFLEPLESTSIHLIQIAITTLIDYLTEKAVATGQFDPRMVEAYNRWIEMEYDRVRDFLILHYHATERDDAPIWNYCRTMRIPDSLAHKMELFRTRARVVTYKDGLFLEPSWLAVYFGQRIMPRGYDRRADAQDPAEAREHADPRAREDRPGVGTHARARRLSAAVLPGRTGQRSCRSARVSEIRSIIVAGSGPIAWISAAALLRAHRQRPPAVLVVDVPGTDVPVGRWTVPSQRGMHALLGIAEPHFVQQTGATYKLATEHLDWQGAGSRYLHAHGEIGAELGGAPFYKFLQSESLAGRASMPEAFSVAGAAARLGRFARPMGKGRALTASFTYGFHLEEQAYARYLRAHALALGVREASAPFAAVLRLETGDIQALRLTDGTHGQRRFLHRLLGSAGVPDRSSDARRSRRLVGVAAL